MEAELKIYRGIMVSSTFTDLEARRLGRPILLFLMAEDHPVTKGDIEPDSKKRKKLEAFRKQAKRVDPSAPAEHVYETSR